MSAGDIDAREQLWDDFLQRWPLERLERMTLAEYSTAGDGECFTYWMEARTDKLGSIWGGSAFKFGIYSRDPSSDRSGQSQREHVRYSNDYGWYAKYGDTPETAFEQVRAQVLKVARAARAGQLEAVEQADLGHAFKWKLAFLYQDRSTPEVLPIYRLEYLQKAAGSRSRSGLDLQRALMRESAGLPVLAYYDEVLARIQAELHATLTTEQALAFLQESGPFNLVKEPTKKMAGFRAANGRELALALDNKRVTLHLEPGAWLDEVEALLSKITHHPPGKSPSSNLAANTPRLAPGNPIVSVVVPDRAALEALCLAYAESAPHTEARGATAMPETTASKRPPLNQILFGPPGTGKTHATVDKALEVLAPEFLTTHADDRETLKAHFDELVEAKRIRFVTFHQSFSYEDFVEGLRAQTNDDNQIKYRVEDGVFKRICDAARTSGSRKAMPTISDTPRIWKVSVDGTWDGSATRQYCMAHNEARIGWREAGDLTQLDAAPNPYFDSLGFQDQSSLRYFGQEISKGDIIVCIASAKLIGAVGVVSGEYRYEPSPPSGVRNDYTHVLPVEWIYRDLAVSVLPLNDNKRFTQKTVYELDRFSWGDLLAHLEQSGAKPETTHAAQPTTGEPHMLIIDEINRGNVSRVFGELITLIEDSKREGRPEALRVQLPYSKRPFSVPDNVYLIGTMNTADRSLASLDIALRRRFSFVEMPPRPDLLDEVQVQGVNIGQLLRAMNERIEVLLDRDHCLGHAYFMPLADDPTPPRLAEIFRANILPLLQEYFFEDWQRIQWVLNDHRKPAGLRFLRAPENDVAQLFGPEVNVGGAGQRWTINAAAFGQIEAYAGIIAAQGA